MLHEQIEFGKPDNRRQQGERTKKLISLMKQELNESNNII